MAKTRSASSWGRRITDWGKNLNPIARRSTDVAAMILYEEITTGPYQVDTGRSRRGWRIATGGPGSYVEPEGIDLSYPSPSEAWTGRRMAPLSVTRAVYTNVHYTEFAQESGSGTRAGHHHISNAARRAVARIRRERNIVYSFA